MGLAFAFGWTPCIGPILAAILSVAAAEATVSKGAGLLAVYSLGLGIPFLIAAFMVERFSIAVLADETPFGHRGARNGSADGHYRDRFFDRRHILGEHLATRDISGAAEFRLAAVFSPWLVEWI